jgi:hypothetical protein
MIRMLIALALVGLLACCGGTSGKPLPVLRTDDPTFPLQPDHFDSGASLQ